MKTILFVDEEIMGHRIECNSMKEVKNEVLKVLDENVFEISIKKRAVKDNSPSVERTA